jgi:ornithine cyclodeaminase
MRVYEADAVHAALPWGPLAAALEQAFREGAQVPPRHAHALGGGDTLLLMPAWDERLIVTKLVTVMPGQAPTVRAQVLALARQGGAPRALLDGEAVTLRRTAATSALAARHLARTDARQLLVVGAGALAGWMARAHAALRPGLRLRVWARRPDAANALAAALQREGLPAEAAAAAEDLQAAVRNADIVCCATTSAEPLVRGAWLAPGTHLDLVGSFRPSMREVDDAAVAAARVVVDTPVAVTESGDLAQPLARGAIAPVHVLGDLAALLRGEIAGRRGAGEVTLFKSVGSALADLAAVRCVLDGG